MRFKRIALLAALMCGFSLSYANSKHLSDNNERGTDTLFLANKDYRILSSDEYSLNIEVTNAPKIEAIKKQKYTVIIVEEGKQRKTAKANNITSSSVPGHCDLFFCTRNGYLCSGAEIHFSRTAAFK